MQYTSILTLFLTLLCLVPSTGFSMDIGVFTRNEPNCTVRKGSAVQSCAKGTVIAESDEVMTSRKADKLGIRWVLRPNAHLSLIGGNDTPRYIAVYDRQEGSRSFLGKSLDILGFMKIAAQPKSYMVTRAGGETPHLPGPAATALPRREIVFFWGGTNAGELVVTAKTGKVLFSTSVAGKTALNVTPEALGLAPGDSVSWRLTGTPEAEGTLTVLSNQEATSIENELKKVSATPGKRADRQLAQAQLLHFISEAYPQQYQLDWLAFNLLPRCTEGCPTATVAEVNALRQLLVQKLNREVEEN